MRLDIPVWINIQDYCTNDGINQICSNITQVSYVNILQPDFLFILGTGAIFGFLTYVIYKRESKKESQNSNKVKME
ncbi:MAG TPA: hypothetical protein VLE02_05180 [Nitrosarchaeum sp.]|nr:hypothetical protein [Nitrosarchaeum sp.]